MSSLLTIYFLNQLIITTYEYLKFNTNTKIIIRHYDFDRIPMFALSICFDPYLLYKFIDENLIYKYNFGYFDKCFTYFVNNETNDKLFVKPFLNKEILRIDINSTEINRLTVNNYFNEFNPGIHRFKLYIHSVKCPHLLNYFEGLD